jgi:hypothetical protein
MKDEDISLVVEFKVALHYGIEKCFSFDEIVDLCYRLGIDPEEITGTTKSVRIWNLINYVARRGMLDQLVRLVKKLRPSVSLGPLRPIMKEDMKEDERHYTVSWQSLKASGYATSKRYFDNARTSSRSWYDKSLYLQRQDVNDAFEDFLGSSFTVFLLLGNSGVGKTNFILSMVDKYTSEDTMCPLLYNGAKLETTQSLIEIIGQNLGLTPTIGSANDLFNTISQIDGINRHQVVLFIDALNENPNASVLLTQIDKLVDSLRFPWFKVVISCRPEAWRSIKRSTEKTYGQLTYDRYYCRRDKHAVGTEFEECSNDEQQLGWEVKRFSHAELPIVYDKYRQVYHLHTAYSELPGELEQRLNDPLTLRLISETDSKGPIKDRKQMAIYEDYLVRLKRDERLREQDLHVLRSDLIPFMLPKNGDYKQAINEVQIESEVTSNGRKLFDCIYNDNPSNGERPNQSFINLVDSELLVIRQKSGLKYEVAFKYERFYDYFAGERLCILAKDTTDPHSFFKDLIVNVLPRKPFLWGAIKMAIIEQIRANDAEIVKNFCFTDQKPIKEMMVSVLEDFGLEDLGATSTVLNTLLPSQVQPNMLAKIWRYLHASSIIRDPASRNARKIAIEVASKLGQSCILQRGSLYSDPEVRASTVRWLYYLWQHNSDGRTKGFQVLESISLNIFDGVIPNRAALETALGFSFSIFFSHSHDIVVLERLQRVWKPVIAKIFWLNERDLPLVRALKQIVTGFVLDTVVKLAFKLLKEGKIGAFFNISGLESFFKLGDGEKGLFKRITQSIDIDNDTTKEQLEVDILGAVSCDNLLMMAPCFLTLVAHFAKAPNEYLPLLNQAYKKAIGMRRLNYYVSSFTLVPYTVLVDDSSNDQLYHTFVDMIRTTKEFNKNYGKLRSRTFIAPSDSDNLGPYIVVEYLRRNGSLEKGWFAQLIEAELAENAIAFFKGLLFVEMKLVAIDAHQPHAALQVLSLFFNQGSQEVKKMSQEFLSLMRIHYPDEVDDFLLEHSVSDEYCVQVKVNEPIETVGELIGARVWDFLREDMILGSPELRRRLVAMLTKAGNCPNAHTWTRHVFSEVANIVYGMPVL